jgi:molybdenum ABC transporter molybdate-binding protein
LAALGAVLGRYAWGGWSGLQVTGRPLSSRIGAQSSDGSEEYPAMTNGADADFLQVLLWDTLFTNHSGIEVVASYAASSALMMHIEQGASADVFLSADTEWMDYGAKRNLIKNDTRENLLGNRLVLAAPKDSKIDKVSIAPGFDLAALVGNGRIATGDVRAVLAGLYAKAALEKLGVWSSVVLKLTMSERAAEAQSLQMGEGDGDSAFTGIVGYRLAGDTTAAIHHGPWESRAARRSYRVWGSQSFHCPAFL